jgi:Tol biopolymer transport system component
MFSKNRWLWLLLSLFFSFVLCGFSQKINMANGELGLVSKTSFEGVIAYVGLDGDIYILFGETGQRIQLTYDSDQHQYRNLQFSPDNQLLAFLKSDSQKGESRFDLYVLNLLDKTTRMLAEDVENYDFAPDGESIAFGYDMRINCQSYDRNTAHGIWKVSLVTGQLEEIIPASANTPKDSPAFSFDGQWLSYQEYPCFSSGFVTHVWSIVSHEDINLGIGDLEWAPDKNLLLWSEDTSYSGGGIAGVILRSPDDKDYQLIYQDKQMTAYASFWSPSKKWIAIVLGTPIDSGPYFAPSEMERRLVLVKPDGSQLQEIYPESDFGSVIWSPTGEQIIFKTNVQEHPVWKLYQIDTQELIGLPDFGVGELDWTSTIDIPQAASTEITPTQTITSASNPEIFRTESITNVSINSSNSKILILSFGGIGLIIISGVILLFVLLNARKK